MRWEIDPYEVGFHHLLYYESTGSKHVSNIIVNHKYADLSEAFLLLRLVLEGIVWVSLDLLYSHQMQLN